MVKIGLSPGNNLFIIGTFPDCVGSGDVVSTPAPNGDATNAPRDAATGIRLSTNG